MNYRFFELTKKALYGLCLAVISGGFLSCNDRFPLDDEGNYPSWLGSSVYEQLKNPNPEVLTGTFNNYVRLIEDMGYAETLGKTGSKTVFAANDEAFERFYANNAWGVRKYEDLTEAMKKQLLYSSMLDNAILVEMLSNVSYDATSVTPGIAMKHTTGANVIDTITFIAGPAGMPKNNSYWQKYFDKGINLVMDATRPMMVHFTAEQLTNNSITTRGENSDFEVITGTPYNDEENSAYIFRNKIIKGDVTCKNGYIHQLQDVLVPPGNIAELIRTNGESFYFSRMLDRFSVPVYDAATTNNYNDFAQANGLPLIDSIFQKRYFSSRSQGSDLTVDPNGAIVKSVLPYDPGWNTYTNGMSGSNALSDLAAIFVPTDEAMKKYFLPGGSGSFLIDQFGVMPNEEQYLNQNIDSIPLNIVQAFLNNLMKNSFIGTVPSKFGDVMDDASDPMGLSPEVINKNEDGTYDVKIANNGVAYMLNTVFAPNRYIAVSAPALLTSNMKVMNTAIQDGYGSTPLNLNLNFYAYLLAMSANYAFFIPTDEAFAKYYVDPTFLKHDQPRVLKFYYQNQSPYVMCSAWAYDPQTGAVGDSLGTVTTANFRSQLVDILNYHTVVLGEGEKVGTNRFLKTKHGGEILFSSGRVQSGGQIDNGLPTAYVTKTYNQQNGTAFAIDHLIQAPQKSVYNVLSESPQFSEFMALCDYLSSEVGDTLMGFASDRLSEINVVTKKRRMDAYHVFAAKRGLTDNINYFNTYNYTVYAPDNDAMAIAYKNGLPRWEDIHSIYEQWVDSENSEERQNARNKVLAMIEEINAFIRYHFQDNSVYADNVIEEGTYATASADTLGIREKLNVKGGNGIITLTDKRGNNISINENDSRRMVNMMTRDYVFNNIARNASSISASSFAVVHQISTPLNQHPDTDRFDAAWTGPNARARLKAFRRLYDSQLYKRY
jgi:uncharacterized surface protein with fasciclin (FAS1) repeats